ncbi:unnamed protein product [Lymnaea stagnalis]|uniref:Uncharacterized protein n=1 Tax=Lymnaea stagnalis TaxID=6523 RepID=A0AAV2HMS0_LYMST
MVSTKIISAFLACIHFVYADNLTLINYRQNDSNTTCQSGVLRGVDQSALKSVILLDRSVGDYDYANFEIKEELESKFKQVMIIKRSLPSYVSPSLNGVIKYLV